jgi:NAD(P)-dependent dehydrogenase (short-subunit alcohol dehydrogenase family)
MGLASALALRRHGASVAILDRDRGRAERAAALLGDETPAFVIDALDSIALEFAVSEVASRLGGLEILVNVVGMTHFSTLDATSVDAFRSEFELNLTHVFVAASAFARLPSECSSGRAVVHIGSSAGLRSAPSHGAYGAAKAALAALTQTMAVEWASRGIRVNCIAPGIVKTDRMVGTPELDALVAEIVPLRRRGTQDEIGSVVLFLVSDLSSYITGQTVVVDGGVMSEFPLPNPTWPGSLFGEA